MTTEVHYICDGCGANDLPRDFVFLNTREPIAFGCSSIGVERHFCGWACVEKWARLKQFSPKTEAA